MFTQPSSHIPESPDDFAFQRQEYFSPFPDQSEDHDPIRDTNSFREQNTEQNFADQSNNSRYVKHPTDNWNDHLDTPAKTSRNDDGFGRMNNDNLPYQRIDYGHRKLAPPIYDGDADRPFTQAQQPESQVGRQDPPNSVGIVDQELFQLFEDGLNLMIENDHTIQAILEFDTRLSWVLSPIFKDWDLDAVMQRLGQGEEAAAAKKLETMVLLTKKKIWHLYEEIIDISARNAVQENKCFTQPDPSSSSPENQMSHPEDDLNFGGSTLPPYGDLESNTLVSPYMELPPDVSVQGSFPTVPEDNQSIPMNPVCLPPIPLGPRPLNPMAFFPYGDLVRDTLTTPYVRLLQAQINPAHFPLIPFGPRPPIQMALMSDTHFNNKQKPKVTPAVAPKKKRKGRCLRKIPLETAQKKK